MRLQTAGLLTPVEQFPIVPNDVKTCRKRFLFQIVSSAKLSPPVLEFRKSGTFPAHRGL
jgi:hypothetical protein